MKTLPWRRSLPMTVALLAMLLAGGCLRVEVEPHRGPSRIPEPAPPPVLEAQGDLIVWTWQEPKLGAAALDGTVIRLVRHNQKGSGARVANRVCNEIKERGLRSGQVAITIQNFGTRRSDTPLWNHPDDMVATKNGAMPTSAWSAGGIEANREWMASFIARYRERQRADPDIPDPHRFHFDSEGYPTGANREGVITFTAMQADARWSTERVPGHDGATMAQLYARAGRPSAGAHSIFYTHPTNHEWMQWFGSVSMTAADGALAESAYDQIRRAWPRCRSSNWWTSAGFDGRGDPPRRNIWHANKPYGGYTCRPSASLAAPVLYWERAVHKRPGESDEDAAIRIARAKLERIVRSWPELGLRGHVTPWLECPGNRRGGRAPSERMFREIVTAAVESGAREILIWGDGYAEDWNALARVVESLR